MRQPLSSCNASIPTHTLTRVLHFRTQRGGQFGEIKTMGKVVSGPAELAEYLKKVAARKTRLAATRQTASLKQPTKPTKKRPTPKSWSTRPPVNRAGAMTRSRASATGAKLQSMPNPIRNRKPRILTSAELTARAKALCGKGNSSMGSSRAAPFEDDEFADLPHLLPFGEDEVEDHDPDNFCEIVFAGKPEVPAKRWLTASTEVGKKVLEFLDLYYGEGEMPRATTLEEAIDCIEMVKRHEKISRESQFVKDILQVLERLHIPYCPLFLYSRIRTWIIDHRNYMKKRNEKMLCAVDQIMSNPKTVHKKLCVKQEITLDASRFTSKRTQTLRNYLEGYGDGRMPVCVNEKDAYALWTVLFKFDWQYTCTTTIDFYNFFKPYPNTSWVQLYKGVRPFIQERYRFNRKQLNQFTKVMHMIQAKNEQNAALQA